MDAEPHDLLTAPAAPRAAVVEAASTDESTRLLTLAGRMMLEFNVRSSVLRARLDRLAKRLGVEAKTSVTYRALTIYFGDGRSAYVEAHEYRLNVATSSEVLRLVDAVDSGTTSPAAAIEQLRAIESAPPQHGRWRLTLMFGLAACALAWILKGDLGSILVAGLSSAMGLILRRLLAKRHPPLLLLPFSAALLGGLMGGLAVRLGFTKTPGLSVMVPALMLVPGPHLINGLFDIFENQIATGVYRLVLSAFILLAAALGTFVGGWLVIDLQYLTDATSDAVRLTLWLDMVLAGSPLVGLGRSTTHRGERSGSRSSVESSDTPCVSCAWLHTPGLPARPCSRVP